MGNKKRLIQRGMIDLFPQNINTFYDLFGGSGVVSLNVKADKYVLNELDTHVYNLYKILKNTTPEEIINHIESRIDEYDLPKKSTHSSKTSRVEREFYKAKYIKFRDNYNKDKNPLDLFVLMNYCMSQTVRFNNEGDFNMPFGSDRFIKEKHSQRYIDFYLKLNSMGFSISNKSYLEFNPEDFNDDDFVYLDPPYLNTIATYNENGKWTEERQRELFDYCIELNKKNIKWAMSNVLKNKEQINNNLIEWSGDHNLNVYGFDNFNYSNFGKEVFNAKEVLITNY